MVYILGKQLTKEKGVPERSALFTPYHLTPGGGERVVLSFLEKIQSSTGQHVDLIVKPDNKCSRVDCVKDLAENLNVPGIKWDRVSVVPISRAQASYGVWWSMGNELFPSTPSRGVLGIYHCQFPFDGSTGRIKNIDKLYSYDVVYLNSQYTNHWYWNFLHEVKPDYVRLPIVTHFPPPFDPLDDRTQMGFPSMMNVVHIVLLGRIFEGTQSKRHMLAIDAFEKLTQTVATNRELRLTLMGHVATGHIDYYRRLKARAATVDGVTLIDNAAHSELIGVLHSAHVVWSLTGTEKTQEMTSKLHPADAEHFGLALLQAMSLGLIPVSSSRGGPAEIMRDLPSYLSVSSVDDIIVAMNKILRSSQKEIMYLQQQSKKNADFFAGEFKAGMDSMFTLYGRKMTPGISRVWLSVYAHTKMKELSVSRPKLPQECLGKERYAVVYVDERLDIALHHTLNVLASKLSLDWTFHAFVSDSSKGTVLQQLYQFPCATVHHLEAYFGTRNVLDPREEGGYQMFWKSLDFWSAMGDNVEVVLTIQSDALFPAAGNFDQRWLSLDYVGAPWCHEGNWGYLPKKDRPPEAERMLHDTRPLPLATRVGNGGVSIRNLSALKHIIKTAGKLSPPQENEDVFFVLNLDQKKVPRKEEASSFGLEILCNDIPNHQELIQKLKSASSPFPPFAVHKPFDVMEVLLEKGVTLNVIIKLFF